MVSRLIVLSVMIVFFLSWQYPATASENSNVEDQKPFVVIALDGGGTYGYISALILAYIEENVGCHLSEVVDFFAGTSTGSIIAAGMTLRKKRADRKIHETVYTNEPAYSARDLSELYLQQGSKIFYNNTARAMFTLGGFLGPTYSPDGLEKVLDSRFGEVKLVQSLKHVMMITYDDSNKTTQRLSSFDGFYNTCPVKKAVKCSAAAPGYFPKVDGKYIDGGVSANNPTSEALDEVEKVFNRKLRDVRVVSIGTGCAKNYYMKHPSRNASSGLLSFSSLPEDMIAGNVQRTHRETQKRFDDIPDGIRRYWRFNPQLKKPGSLSDASESAFVDMKSLAQQYIHANKKGLDEVVEMLKGLRSVTKHAKSLESTELRQ
ncbi:MAG: patatin-like phospholipase family protein [Alphaproteobacteria bacterium]